VLIRLRDDVSWPRGERFADPMLDRDGHFRVTRSLPFPIP
jgi:hypothetical protein